MLHRRIVTVLTFVEGVLFRTKLFEPDYRYTLNFVDAWSVDEVVVLDITRDRGSNHDTLNKVIESFAHNCFVPLAAGGGVRTLEDVKHYLNLGADKVVVNTGAIENPELITHISHSYGNQCCVLSLDARRAADGNYEVYSQFGSHATGRDAVGWAQEAEALGVGEILVTSIERDGSLSGYDLDLCRHIADAVSVPVLICGGAGNWNHFLLGFTDGGADAVCTTNIYHFTEASIHSAKIFLEQNGIPVRVQ